MRSATIVFGSLATALLLAAIYLSSSPIARNNLSYSFDSSITAQEDNANSKLTFLVVGDYGWPDSDGKIKLFLFINNRYSIIYYIFTILKLFFFLIKSATRYSSGDE
jgi:hypothetical protein